MSMEQRDWTAEQQRIERVKKVIEERISVLREEAGLQKSDVVDIRKHFWEDVTISFDDPNDAIETYASIKQQADLLSEKERSYRLAAKKASVLERLLQSPYFGRIDFLEDGMPAEDRIYIGLASLLDEDELDFLIYDWRAPISSMYYDFLPGPASYETPSGTIRGVMKEKRQYVIRSGQLEGMFDAGITIGDQLLREMLGKRADTHMKTIVSTIQKEQNRIIRNEKSRVLIVQGAAGSGKTSAALQRIAYLLYRYRGMLTADQIVLFSPNPIFNGYISTVLPELGEENMQQTTLQEYLEHRIGETFKPEDPFDQMEYTLTSRETPGYSVRMAGIRAKSSAWFMQALERYTESLAQCGICFKDVVFRGEALITADEMKKQFYAYDASIRVPNRIRLLSQWLLAKLDRCEAEIRRQPWVEEEVGLLDQDEYLWAYKELQKQNRFSENSFDDFDKEFEFLAEKVVEAHFRPLRAWAEQLGFLDTAAIYSLLYRDAARFSSFTDAQNIPEEWADICEQTAARLELGELPYEDAAPFVYVKERLEGFHTNRSIRHVFIDEAQDYSPFHYAFISRLFPRAKMTLLGDFNQAIFPNAGSGFAAAEAWFDPAERELIVLPRSYRSTRQIVEFTRELVKEGGGIEPFERDGPKPIVSEAPDRETAAERVASLIHRLQSEGYRTIAVICKTASETKDAFDRINRRLSAVLITKESAAFVPGVSVIPSYLAKGVEFDAAIVYDASASQYGEEEDRKLLYTVCTRAMHELHLFYIGEMSPFIQDAAATAYELKK
ncbi:RNA polymerase recycling motor HelD [Paenibacillus thermotolerans]|uniref:RNA polymerase recycling motor HelD n=1 Tax=Paenibacillus thermotolerans TaxID=3027807 RepID=UPI002368C570|nr:MULTISPECIES: RNA polymerase recycling motor HelD [unclassified Paenibacillus]